MVRFPLILVEKIFTRKLRVPTKHVVTLADPCDALPSLTIKHLYVALLKIIQTDITNRDEQNRIKDTLRQIEKSPAGSDSIFTAALEWLDYMDSTCPPPDGNQVAVASKMIDWAIGTIVCRDELDIDFEKLKTLKSENTAAIKKLKSGIRHPL